TLEPTALSVGIGYARALTDRFSIGGRVKFATQDLGSTALSGTITDGVFTADEFSDDKLDVFAFDFGMLYKTGFRSLTFAVAATNFSEEIEFVDESFQLPLTLRIGVSMNVADFMPSDSPHSLLVAIEAENPRDFSEHINMGLEYGFFDTLFLRAGYTVPIDEQGISLGAGLAQGLGGLNLSADYAYTDFGVFSAVHRMAFQLSF
ncbi:MAG: PorV/PorQ family protein, partial [Rhodothermales bacterium]|nr:PorV/PorQ family protein [Rhodothermales bacterium]